MNAKDNPTDTLETVCQISFLKSNRQISLTTLWMISRIQVRYTRIARYNTWQQ